MKVQALREGGYAIFDADDLIQLPQIVYEVLYCAVPIDHGSLHAWLMDSILTDEADRASMAGMVERLGGVEPAMARLQERIQALPPVSSPADETLAGEVAVAEKQAPPPAVTPAAKPPATSPPAAPPEPTAAPARLRTILLIEPSDWSARKLQDHLRHSAFTVAARVHRIEDGLEHYRKHRTDLVVLDLASTGAAECTLGGGCTPVRRFLDLDPNCRLVVSYALQYKPLLLAAIRAGASAHLLQPFERVDTLYALEKALTSRTWTPAPSAVAIKRCLACAWKSDDRGLFGAWEGFVARALDLKGLEGIADEKLKVGWQGRLRLRLGKQDKPMEVPAEVASCQWDTARRQGVVRFKFLNPSLEALERLSDFLSAIRPKRSEKP